MIKPEENHQLRYLYILLSMSNLELATKIEERIPSHEKVAAEIIMSGKQLDFTTEITAIDEKKYSFTLDLNSRVFQSKGNWIWVKQAEFFLSHQSLFSISINTRVIDIPYTNTKACAYWLLKNFYSELDNYISSHL